MYRTILDQSIAGKTLIVRIDLNSNFQNGKLQVSERFIQHAKALSALADKGARVVVLAHQGRKGDPDFFPLESHGEVLEKLMGRKVKLVPWNVDYVAEVKRLNDGEVILMQNVRKFA